MDSKEYENLIYRLEKCEDECRTAKYVSVMTIITTAFIIATVLIFLGVL